MTEQEWLEYTEPQKMLAYLRTKGSARNWYLFTLACDRVYGKRRSALGLGVVSPSMLEEHFENQRSRDGTELELIWNSARHASESAIQFVTDTSPSLPAYLTGSPLVRRYEVRMTLSRTRDEAAERIRQCKSLRDIFGNPFRPITLDRSSFTSTVLSIAQAIYAEKAFDRMPILADALEEAGVTNQDILTHCRLPGDHVRGCWAVDLVLGKQ